MFNVKLLISNYRALRSECGVWFSLKLSLGVFFGGSGWKY